MKDSELVWKDENKTQLLHTCVFDVTAKECVSATGVRGRYFVMDAPDWCVVIPEKGDRFLTVRQWRHGSTSITTEFPGGVVEKGEDPAVCAARELEEETAHRAGSLVHLGSVSPNPALFTNRLHIYLARDLVPIGAQHLDEDEFVNYVELPISEVIANYGKGELTHAYTGTALGLYLARKAL